MSDNAFVNSNEPSPHTLGYTRFLERVITSGVPFVENEIYTSNTNLDNLVEHSIAHSRMKDSEDMLIERDNGALVRVYRSYDDINVWVGASDRTLAKDALTWVKSIIPEYEDKNEDVIPVTFWALSHNGPTSVNRRIEVPKWESIRNNYEATVQQQLDHMMTAFQPAHGGQLILWEGNPGTGKTYSLRALGDSWRKWAKLHYITDPEEFFGEASYMIQVLLQGSSSDYYYEDSPKAEEKWNVLILEDCGELLSADAKERTGQAVSRLLNVVDGMIGQGLKILVLVTTNEPVKKFHSAVTRPGRCAMHIEYKPLSVNDANDWLAAHGSDKTVDKATTIAELFGKIEGYEVAEPNKKVGFGS